jgi:hypothetical protein
MKECLTSKSKLKNCVYVCKYYKNGTLEKFYYDIVEQRALQLDKNNELIPYETIEPIKIYHSEIIKTDESE